jgi:hypothetical protein
MALRSSLGPSRLTTFLRPGNTFAAARQSRQPGLSTLGTSTKPFAWKFQTCRSSLLGSFGLSPFLTRSMRCQSQGSLTTPSVMDLRKTASRSPSPCDASCPRGGLLCSWQGRGGQSTPPLATSTVTAHQAASRGTVRWPILAIITAFVQPYTFTAFCMQAHSDLSGEDLASSLTMAGVTRPEDIAGLTRDELAELLSPENPSPSDLDNANVDNQVAHVQVRNETAITCAESKMLVLAGIHHLVTHVARPNFERLRAINQRKANLLRIVTTATLWGAGCEAILPPTSDKKSAPAPDSYEEVSSSSSNDSDSDPDSTASQIGAFPWLCPQGGMVHVAFDTCEARPPCCNHIFKICGYAESRGLVTTPSLTRLWCPKCFLKLPPTAAK